MGRNLRLGSRLAPLDTYKHLASFDHGGGWQSTLDLHDGGLSPGAIADRQVRSTCRFTPVRIGYSVAACEQAGLKLEPHSDSSLVSLTPATLARNARLEGPPPGACIVA